MKEDILRCICCGKLTTKVEAHNRVFLPDHCGHCGGQLIQDGQCGRKTRVEGRNFLCVAETGHSGPHRYDVKVPR